MSSRSIGESAMRTCGSCGGRLLADALRCSFCGGEQHGSMSARTPLSVSVHDAFARWGRTLFAAPLRLDDHIERIEVRDEVIERVATEIVRREVREERLPTNRTKTTSAGIHASAVDPYEMSLADLRSASEHVTPCAHCRGSGVASCNYCSASGRMRCSNCSGSGKERKYYKKSSRLVNCQVCRASGTVPCASCGGRGSVTCSLCSGTGNQLAWLTYGQEARWHVVIDPDTVVVHAHPQLREHRYLGPQDLDDFSVVGQAAEDGAISFDGYRDSERPIFRALASSLDRRLERVNRQQYLKLAVVRRDVTYSLAGTKAVVVLSGRDLVASRTKQSAAPVRRRNYLWIAGAMLTSTVLMATSSAFGGHAAFYSETVAVRLGLASVGMFASIPAFAALARELGRWRLRVIEKAALGLVGSSLVLLFIVGLAMQPRVAAVEGALARGDVARARTIVDGLEERLGQRREVLDAKDAVMIAESEKVALDARIKALDAVAARGGSRADEAAARARDVRLHEIRAQLTAGAPDKALASIGAWFSKGPFDREVSEEQARAHDLMVAKCDDLACRLHATSEALAASATPERTERAATARAALISELSVRTVQDEPALATLKRQGALARTSNAALSFASKDAEVAAAATDAAAWADAARAKTALLGAEVASIEELLGARATTVGASSWILVDDARVHLVLDGAKRCRGIYVVGATPGKRGLHGSTWPADRLLSQTIGRKAAVKRPTPDTSVTARWFEVIAPVVARWKGADLVELRIGDASP